MIPPDSCLAPASLESMLELARSSPPGLFAEVGVYKGGSAWHLATLGRELHLFDSFSGMPLADPEDNHRIGDFADTSLNLVRAAVPDAIFHVGTFPETLPEHLTGFAFVHVDCDQYRSVRDCIRLLGPRMVSGGIMLFDDWSFTTGATRAIDEAFPTLLRTAQQKAYVIFP